MDTEQETKESKCNKTCMVRRMASVRRLALLCTVCATVCVCIFMCVCPSSRSLVTALTQKQEVGLLGCFSDSSVIPSCSI